MISFRRLAAGTLAAVLLALPLVAMIFLTGCRKEEKILIDTNLAPNTRLTSAPAPYDQMNYRVHMRWAGTDPDGFVVGYYFAWDDTIPGVGADPSAWTFTDSTHQLFKAQIDTAGETRRHTFYVRAVDNEGSLDPTPARIRFDAWTIQPVVDSLYRANGPEDAGGDNYNPGYKDTVLMYTPCVFIWGGHDPDGQGAPVEFSYRLDSAPFTEWADITTATVENITSGTHFFYVKARDETGSENFPENAKFVMNYDPDSEILEPTEPTGTLTISDRDTIWFRWDARDREEDEGLEGGVIEVWITLDVGFQKRFTYDGPPYTGEWYFTSNTFASDEHYISSINKPTGGNNSHFFAIYAKDVENRFETTSELESDHELYMFWYNFPPTSEITFPAAGNMVPQDFTVTWEGTDIDGEIVHYQYVLDPLINSWQITEDNFMEYEDIEVGEHKFNVRALDNAGCWEEGYQEVIFHVSDSK
jgi:hypothetical protein